ncbi:MAG: MFS transporter [Candidatus Lokiarchaeota archaeon]|nr:MFS transporter [Candidatus Lokiarchaeota archaeon]
MTSALQPQKTKFNRHLIIIFIIMFTEVLGFSMVLPIIPFLGLSLGLNAFEIGLIMSIFSFSQLFASPITGKLSDHFGRKPILLISQISTLIGFVLLGFASSVWLLVAARLVDGLIGSNMTVSQAYISDVTSPQDRTKIYGYSSAVFGAGLIFGPVIGGTLSTINYSIPMFLAALISLISIILVILFLPESLLLKREKIKIKFNDIVPINEAKHFFKEPNVRKLLLLFFIYSLGFMLFISSFPLFAEQQVHVTAQEVGFLITWIGILRVIFQILLINPLQKKFGENSVLSIGIISMVFTMVILVFTTDYIFAYFPLIFIALGTGVCRPILTSKLTKSINKEETGSILGVNNALSSIAQIIAPILGGAFIQYFPSFFLPALSATFFIILFFQWIKGSKIKLKN